MLRFQNADEQRAADFRKMNEAFCAAMQAAIDAGLEKAFPGVVSTPGTDFPILANNCGPVAGVRSSAGWV